MKQVERLAGASFAPEEISDVMHDFEDDGTLIKGFLVDDLQDICWGRLDMLEGMGKISRTRDLVIPPSAPLCGKLGTRSRSQTSP